MSGIPLNVMSGKHENGASSATNGTRRHEPVYAQVNRAEKLKQRQKRELTGSEPRGDDEENDMGGDSWV